jgi:hypothetical protein
MGGGKPILTFILTCAIVGTGKTITNAKSIIPKSNFFILLPPLIHHCFAAHQPFFISILGLLAVFRPHS